MNTEEAKRGQEENSTQARGKQQLLLLDGNLFPLWFRSFGGKKTNGKKNGRNPDSESHVSHSQNPVWGTLGVSKTLLGKNYFHNIKTLFAFFTLIFPQVYSVSQRLQVDSIIESSYIIFY